MIRFIKDGGLYLLGYCALALLAAGLDAIFDPSE
jgi:hypothetical protein